MNFRNLALLILAIFSTVSLTAQTEIARWTYEPVVGNVAAPESNFGNGTSMLVGSMTDAGTATGINTESGCGPQTTGTNAWAINPANPGTANESSGAQWMVSTVGFNNIQFRFEQRWSNASANTIRIQYTINGTQWINFDLTEANSTFCLGTLNNGRFEANTTGDQFRRITVNFSAITAANNNANFGVRVVAAHFQNTGEFRRVTTPETAATAGTWRFDNVIFSGSSDVPNPTLETSLSSISTLSQILPDNGTPASFSISAFDLTQSINLTVTAPFEVSNEADGIYQTSWTLPLTQGGFTGTLFVRLNANIAGTNTGTITLSSAGVSNAVIDLFGVAFQPNLTIPAAHSLANGPYSFTEWNADAPAGTYPANMVFWTHNVTDPEVTTEFIDDYTCGYDLPNRSRVTGQGLNGFSFVNTGNAQFFNNCTGTGDLDEGVVIPFGRLGAAVLSLNTTGVQNVVVEWVGRTIAQNSRVYGLRMQFRIGTGANANDGWTNISAGDDAFVEYISGETGDNQSFSTALPETVNNQPLVQVRWVYYNISGSGARAELALDDINITSVLSSSAFEKSTVAMYPNPVNGGQSIFFTEMVSGSVFNMSGQRVLNFSNAQNVALPSLNAGVYLVTLDNGATHKLVVK